MQVLKNNKVDIQPTDVSDVLLSTYNFKRVQATCADALKHKKMIALVGDPGLGKTCGLRYFQSTNKNVFYLTVKPSMTAKSFWEALFDKVPASDKAHFGMNTRRALYFTLQAAASLLNSYEQCLLVIDEAGKLNPRMLEHLHELRDDTENTTGIILAGPEYFRRNLTRWVNSERIGMPEVWRRINYWEELLPPDKSEIKEFCRHFGITDPDVIRKLILECKNFGILRNHVVEYLAGNYKL